MKENNRVLGRQGRFKRPWLAVTIIFGLAALTSLACSLGSLLGEQSAPSAGQTPVVAVPVTQEVAPESEQPPAPQPQATVAPIDSAPAAAGPALTLNPTTGAAGSTVKVSGAGFPAGSRIVISLAPSQPPAYAVNSALADTSGNFAVDLIVPSDPRWLDESPVPIVAAVDGQNAKAQAALTIVAPGGGAPAATAAASSDIVIVAAVPSATPPPPPASAAQLTTTANLNVRSGPGTNYDILGVLLLGQQAEIIGRNQDATWWQIKFAGAKQGFGWVSAQFAQASNIGNVPIVNAPAPPPTPAPPAQTPPDVVITEWRGEYFNNKDLSGQPVFVRNDPAVSFDWGLGSPDSRLPADFFSARWTRNVNFSAGTYRFYTRVDDGVRLWVDGALLINQWREQSPVTYAADIYLGDGGHDLRMEWNELAGGATAILSWERVDTFPDWKVEYYNNPDLQGAPVLVRNEGTINHNWGQGSPAAAVPADNFSVRWTRTVYLDGGDYLFRIQSDDGHRMWVDNDLIFDNWRDGNTQLQEARRNIPSGLHQLRVEYFERGGDALIGFAWQRTDRPQIGPLAIIRSPDEGMTGQPVTFDGRRSREGDSRLDKYEWDFGDGSRTKGDKVSHTYNSSGTYRVTLIVTDRNGLRDRTRVDIRINNDPVANIPPVAIIDAASTGQVGQAVNFSGQRSSSVTPIVGYRWNFGDGGSSQDTNPVHTFNAAGLYNVSLTVIAQNGLRSTDNLTVRIDSPLLPSAAPVAKISAPPQGQTGQPVSFDASQSTASSPMVSWLWNFGDGATADGLNIPHAYANPGVYNVTLTVTDQNGQSNSANQLITIAAAPQPNTPPVPVIGAPAQAEAGQTVTFNASGTQHNGQLTNIAWDLGDGSSNTGEVVNYAYTTPGDYTVTLTVTDDQGQSASTTAPIQIIPKAVPDPLTAKISGPTQGQAGQSLAFDGQFSTSAAPLNSIQWDFGDGTSDSGNLVVNHVYQNPGTYTVLLTLVNDLGQTNTASQQVAIQAAPAANQPPQPAIQASAASVVAGDTINLDASGTAAGSPIASYDWDFGDGNTGSGQLASHAYSTAGTYQVTLTVTDQNGLSGSTTTSIDVQAPPSVPNVPPVAAIAGPPTAEVGGTITFDGTPSQAGSPIASYQWDFGDGVTGSGPSVSYAYAQPGSYQVTLTVTDQTGLSGSATSQVDVTLPPPPPPTTDQPVTRPVQPPTAVINGPMQAQVGETIVLDGGFSSGSSPIVSYEWGTGDGAGGSGMGVSYAYGAPGVYQITLTVTDQNGLSSSATQQIEILDAAAQPQPQPEPTQPPAEPQPQPTEPPVETRPAPLPAVPPTAVINGPNQVQAQAQVTFSGQASQPGSSQITSYEWGFGDGGADAGPDVAYAYSAQGTYQVTLTVTDENGLSNTTAMTVFVGPSQAEIEAQQQAEEAQRQAEEAARQQAEAEAQRQAEEAQRQAEAAQQQAAAEATAQAEAQQQAEEAQRQAEEAARQQAEAEAQRQAEEAQHQAEEETRRQAEEAQRQAEEAARRQAEEEAQRQAEEEARRQAEEEALQQAQEAQQQQDAPADGQ